VWEQGGRKNNYGRVEMALNFRFALRIMRENIDHEKFEIGVLTDLRVLKIIKPGEIFYALMCTCMYVRVANA
jgi:hypothetical protein